MAGAAECLRIAQVRRGAICEIIRLVVISIRTATGHFWTQRPEVKRTDPGVKREYGRTGKSGHMAALFEYQINGFDRY